MTHPDLRAVTVIEFAFGAEPGTDPDGWNWTDVTGDLLSQSIEIVYGQQDEESQVQPAECAVELDNTSGDYTPDDPRSPRWPNVELGTPLRITVDADVRFVGEVGSWDPTWPWGDLSGDDAEEEPGEARVTVTASGITRRLRESGGELQSSMRRHYLAQPHLAAYVPLEDGRDAEVAVNLVPETHGVRYGVGAAPDYPRRPGWAEDDSLPGSMPVPEWPVLAYFGWSVGASARIPGPTGPWGVQVTVRVPPGAGEAWLSEWITQGGRYNRWALKTNASGLLQVTGSDGGDPPSVFTHTATTLGAVDDGSWRTITVVVVGTASDGQIVHVGIGADTQQFMASSTPVGRLARLRPRPLYGNPSGKDPIGLAHAAAFAEQAPPGITTRFFNELLDGFHDPPIDGWRGETAAGRVVRLGYEEGVPVELMHGRQLVLDETNHVHNVPAAQLQAVRYPGTGAEVEVLVRGSADTAGGGFGALVKGADENLFNATYAAYAVVDSPSGNSLFIEVISGSTSTKLGPWPGGTVATDTAYWIRIQAAGHVVRMRVWADGAPEPPDTVWHLTMVDGRVNGGNAARLAVAGFDATTVTIDHFQVWDVTSVPVGVQQVATLMDNCQQAADVDTGILAEARTRPALFYRPSSALYNQDAAMVLDAAAGGRGDIVNPFAPVLDDQSRRNDITVERIDGGSARAIDLGHIVRFGRRDSAPTLNAVGDGQLPSLASWRLHLGTWPGMRHPRISPALDVRAELIPAWKGLRLGDRADVTNLPPQHPAPGVQALVRGWTETVTPTSWQPQINASPYGPWEVGEFADDGASPAPDASQRYDTAGCETVDPFSAGTDTELLVNTIVGPLWTTDPADLPMDVAAAGVVLRVTAVEAAPEVNDEFDRTESNGWGTATSGQAWTVFLGDAAEASVGSGVGELAPDGGAAPSLALDVDLSTVEVTCRLRATGGLFGLYSRIDTAGQDAYTCLFDEDGDVSIFLLDGGSATSLTGFQPGPLFVANDWYRMRVRVAGDLIQMRVWPDGDPEPAAWTLQATDDTYTSGGVGAVADVFSGSATAEFDDFEIVDSRQRLTVEAAPVNGIDKQIPAGSDVRLAHPAIYAL